MEWLQTRPDTWFGPLWGPALYTFVRTMAYIVAIIAPLMLMPALAAWAVIPFSPVLVLSNINAGLLYIMALSSMGGSLNLSDIVAGQGRGTFADMGLTFLSWNWLPLLPILVVYFVSGVAETNRAPFDVVEGESEIVAGHMVEYPGMTFALFFLAGYANMMLISALTVVMFFGGWQAPVSFLDFVPAFAWFLIKVFFVVSLFLWFRATFPRYRYDQIMRLGWKIFIPLTIVWIVVVGIWMQTPLWVWWK